MSLIPISQATLNILTPYSVDYHLKESSPSKTAANDGGELGAYGDGGSPPDADDSGLSTTPTVSGNLTRSERWSGEIELTGTVTVDWPHRLVIDPGTRIRVPANAALKVNSIVRVLGTAQSPVIMEAAEGSGQWTGLILDSSAAGSTIRHARISGASYCIQTNGARDEISNNRLSGCGYGIYSASGSPIVTNNLLVENSQAGMYVYSGSPRITYNTLDLNGNYGLYFRLTGGSSVIQNNIVTRNNQGVAGDARSATRGYNNIWLNGNNVAWTAGSSDTDISSDPLYFDRYAVDYRLSDGSSSKTASTTNGEIGAYGNGGNPPATNNADLITEATLEGELNRSERWSGEIDLTGSVTVNWPHRLIIEPGTRITVPANAALRVNSFVRVLGTAESPVVMEAAEGSGLWQGLILDSSGAGSTVHHARISGASYCIQLNGASE